MTQTTLDQWMQQEAIPFSIDAPESLNAAVDRLVAGLGDSVNLLGFGEAIHGSEEILILRNRLFQRLVEAHRYSAIAVESSFPRGRVVNDYILGRGPETYEAIQEGGFSHGFGRLEANRELLEWMRQYNAGPAHPGKIHFYGFDSPTEMMSTDSPSHVLHFALDYLTSLDPQDGQRRKDTIDELLGADADWENPAVSMDPSQGIGLTARAGALRIETEELITELQIRRPDLVARSSAERFAEALQYATLARQLLTYHAGLARTSEDRLSRLLGIRDGMMADLLAGLVTRERGRGRVLAFAQNRHLFYGVVEWQLGPYHITHWPAGAHLKGQYGPRYAVIGTGIGISDDNGIARPEPGTLEARLTATPGPVRFIPTHQGQGLPVGEIAALPTRSGTVKNSTYSPLGPESFREYDALAILDSSTYNRGGPPLP